MTLTQSEIKRGFERKYARLCFFESCDTSGEQAEHLKNQAGKALSRAGYNRLEANLLINQWREQRKQYKR